VPEEKLPWFETAGLGVAAGVRREAGPALKLAKGHNETNTFHGDTLEWGNGRQPWGVHPMRGEGRRQNEEILDFTPFRNYAISMRSFLEPV